MTSERVDELEILVRQLPGVSCVTFTQDGDVVKVQLLVVDPLQLGQAEERAEILARRYLSSTVHVVARLAGAAGHALAAEERLGRVPGVRGCSFERGSRGEVLRVHVSIDDPARAAAVRRAIEDMLGTPLTPARLVIDIEA